MLDDQRKYDPESPLIQFIKALARRQARIDFGLGGEFYSCAVRDSPTPVDYEAVAQEMKAKLRAAST
ncbi:hypothetical protein [Agrobacterium rubi]|uniref:Uncharacterized protein n=1 Tax=Agrobacterium rubi TaxID=28099 RepID=A0ABX2IZP7_9HYPH|nr:hypothetical protein [Agrobacterium rubi]NTF35579.1 hypothetical protein [Agrobacterium rubi]